MVGDLIEKACRAILKKHKKEIPPLFIRNILQDMSLTLTHMDRIRTLTTESLGQIKFFRSQAADRYLNAEPKPLDHSDIKYERGIVRQEARKTMIELDVQRRKVLFDQERELQTREKVLLSLLHRYHLLNHYDERSGNNSDNSRDSLE